jgi:transcriptional regulator with XRE-family HTH domain
MLIFMQQGDILLSKEVYSMSIGAKIKLRRNELQWSQRELSDKMGYSNHSTIARIESGTVDIPQSKIVKFAEVLGVSIGYLMGWEQEEKKNDALADIVLRLRTDDELFNVVNAICNLDKEKLSSLATFLK